MSTTAQVPAHIAERIAARKASGARDETIGNIVKGEGFSFPKISIRASKFRLVEDGVETPVGPTLDVLIVGSNPDTSKIFYAKPYDGSDGVRPDCFSNDGKKPDASIEAPVSESCLTCPHNELGSRILPSGQKSKMCADQRHLAVVPAADPTKAYALTVPVSGMKAMREYLKELANWGLAAREVVTELGFDDKASFPKLTFTRKGYSPAKLMGQIDAIAASDEVKVAVRVLNPQQATLAAPAKAAALPSAVDDAYEEEAAAPVSVKPKKVQPEPEESEPKVVASAELEKKLDSIFDEE